MDHLLFGGTIFAAGIAQAQVVNGSFESGDFAGWAVSDFASPYEAMSVTPLETFHAIGSFASYFGVPPFSETTPTDGVYAMWTGFDGGAGIGSIAQDVFVNRATLRFDYRAAWLLAPFGATQDREFRVVVREAGGGAVLLSTVVLTAPAGTDVADTGAQTASVDLSAFVGQTVQLAFEWSLPESFSGPAGFQLDNVRLEGLNAAPLAFADVGDFGCYGDRFSPALGGYCDYLYNGNYPDTTVYLRAGRDDCFNYYEGQYMFLGVPNATVFSRSAGTSGGLVNARADASGVIGNAFRTGGGTVRARLDLSVSAYVTVPDLEDPCLSAYGGYGYIAGNADAYASIELYFAEPMRLVARDPSGEILPQFAVGDVVPEGYHAFTTSYQAAFANAAYGGGTFENRIDPWAEFEYTDCDANGVNDLREADSDANGVTDACEPVQNLTAGTGFGTIQHAIDQAAPNDVIEIAAGVHAANAITLPFGVDLTIQGVGAGLTVLDGSINPVDAPILDLRSTGQTTDTVFRDMTIRNGSYSDLEGGGGARLLDTSATFVRVEFLNNAGPGGSSGVAHAVSSGTGRVVYDRCVFMGGTDAFDAVNAHGSSTVEMLQCLVANNQTFEAVRLDSTGNVVVNSTIVGDDTTLGRAFLSVGGSIDIVNTVIVGTTVNGGGAAFSLSRCLAPPGVPGDNIGGAPTFVDRPAGDFRLAAGSLGIDAADADAIGLAVTDLAGQGRFRDDAGTLDSGIGSVAYLDIGAYEFQGTSPEPCPADLDASGSLNLDDIDLFAAAFLAGDLLADLDASGSLNLDDVDAFAASFLAGCP